MRILLCTVCALLVGLIAAKPVQDDPLVDLIKEVIYEGDQYIAKNHLDVLSLPNIGLLPWDPVKLRNGRIGNFSSIELVGTPNVQEQDNADGSTTLIFDLLLGLDRVGIDYDFQVSIPLVSKTGTASISTHHDSAEIKGIFVIGGPEKCKATLTSVQLLEFGDFDIALQPDDLPNITAINQAILNFITPKLLPLTNNLINDVIALDFFKTEFSEIACKNMPL